jgi:hypothetical protein
MAPPRDLEGLPPGLARERTELAWSRTVIAFAAVGGAILKTSIAAGLTVIALGVLIGGVARILPGPGTSGAAPGRLRIVAVAVTGVSVVALAVALFGHGTATGLPSPQRSPAVSHPTPARLAVRAPLRAHGPPVRLPGGDSPAIEHAASQQDQPGQQRRESGQGYRRRDQDAVTRLACRQRRRPHVAGAVQPDRHGATRARPGRGRDLARSPDPGHGPPGPLPGEPGIRAVVGHQRPGRGLQQYRGHRAPGSLRMSDSGDVAVHPPACAPRDERAQEHEHGDSGGQEPRIHQV